jgi:hypothetical protein
MHFRLQLLLIITITLSTYSFTQNNKIINAALNDSNIIVISINHDIHMKYGCLYPMTYLINIPSGLTGLTAQRKFTTAGTASVIWDTIPEKTSTDYFNAIEAVRFDRDSGKAYLSVAFSEISDTVFIKITDSSGNIVSSNYGNICKYYDNRISAVTVTSDDWFETIAKSKGYVDLLNLFRSHQLYVTLAVITRISGPPSVAAWANLQKVVDSGFVEAASHSQIHPDTPYANYQGEVLGSYDDIVTYLNLPSLFKFKSKKQFVYTWIAPNGSYNNTIDSMLQFRSYLIPRLDNWSKKVPNDNFSQWRSHNRHFDIINAVDEIGLLNNCGKDTSYNLLKTIFDTTIARGKIYHLQWHPQWLSKDSNKTYLNDFLDYISNRTNIWYVNLGHLYLYHFLQGEDSLENITKIDLTTTPSNFQLYQNYPNPFNPNTSISYSLSSNGYATLKIYDVLGREIVTLVNGFISKGIYKTTFNASRFPSGVYIYQLKTGDFFSSKKMVLMK